MTNHLTDYEADRLASLEAAFDEAGGRGVDLAEEIDALRAKRDGKNLTSGER